MAYIIDLLESYTKQTPNTAILFDEVHKKITYAQLDDMSGRLYAYLKKQGIGKEDFVLIDLPRGVLPIIAMIGIWKAGAAWALVEDTYAPERIAYIRKDCGCKLELTESLWETIMETEPLSGHEAVDPHDAAYAIYTSGTTGNPKGVLHEYGNLERAIDSIRINGETPFDGRDSLALLAPLNFVASVIVILKALSIHGGKMHVVSYATIKNPMALKLFFFEKRISITFLTPSYVRMLGNSTGPFLRMLFVGSEPANNVYNPKLELINIYACSESGFAVGVFTIDKSYETCPIGHPEVDTKITLIQEDGTEAKDGEIGELCFENPYVRGYINLPEESARAFVNGVYHTGDLARKNENGDYVLLGRSNDMIKINGNRIEPAEIEAAAKAVLGVSWAAAKGFEEHGKSYLALYYKDDVTFDPETVRNAMLQRLPYYMIPSFYVKVDQIPLKANGKLDRKALPNPDTSSFKTKYVEPETETEKKICEAMAAVLKLEKVGAEDDFYELGGDSLGSIQVIVNAKLPGLNASEIFRGRTPKKIAALYEEHRPEGDEESPEQRNEEAMKKPHPLTTEQLYMVDYQLYTPKSTMYNLFTMLRFDKQMFDLNKLVDVLNTVIKNHPALLTTLQFNEDGLIEQRYTPDVFEKVTIEKTNEFELATLKDSLVRPFRIINSRLYRCRVFETEKAGYVYFDVHHTVFDGTSMKVFMNNVGKLYAGMMPDPDYYYLMLQKREDAIASPFYEESKEYFENLFNGVEWTNFPTIDHDVRKNEYGEMGESLGISQAQMETIERQYKISRNEFYIAVATLAISIYNKAEDVKISWIFNGREDAEMMTSVGLLFRDLPIGIRFGKLNTIRELFTEVHEQVRKSIEHSIYPFVDKHNYAGGGESAYLLYQQDIRDVGGLDGMDIEPVEVKQNQAASQTILDMQILDGKAGLTLVLDYAASRYETSSMEKYRDLFIAIAQKLAAHTAQEDMTIASLKASFEPKKGFFAKLKSLFSKKK